MLGADAAATGAGIMRLRADQEMETGTRFEEGDDDIGQTQTSTAYDKFRSDIITSKLPPGSKLRIRQMCERYGLAASSIREALNRLTRDGLVQLIDLRGFTVSPISEEDLGELTKARCWLNEKGLRESIANGGVSWEEGVVLAYHRLSRTPRGGSEHEFDKVWETAHRVFHTSLISACGSPWIIRFCEQLSDASDRYRYLSCSAQQERKVSHQDLMEASVSRRANEAVTLLTTHFEETAAYGRAALAERAKHKEPIRIRAAGRRRVVC
jgi:GntR family transcriptional regulator, carbon starvation induced regulator